MAETTTALGTINLWHRSTDVTTLLECQAKYALSRLFPRDADAGYFLLGTAAHNYFADRLNGAGKTQAGNEALDWLWQEIELAKTEGRELRWTKKRPEETIFDDLQMLMDRWDTTLPIMYLDEGWEPVAVERDVLLDVDSDQLGSLVVSTNPDVVFQRDDQYQIVDWKTGATAKANPLQLHVYAFASRFAPDSPLYGVPVEQVGLNFHHVAFSKQQNAEPYPGDAYMHSLLTWVSDQKKGMVESGFAPPSPDWYCDYCLYKSKCPAWGAELTEFSQALYNAETEQLPEIRRG